MWRPAGLLDDRPDCHLPERAPTELIQAAIDAIPTAIQATFDTFASVI